MKKLLSTGFMYAALWVLLVHSIVPHSHGESALANSDTTVSVEHERSLWSQIWEVLQFNPGQEHLETYNIGEQQTASVAILPDTEFEFPTANLVLIEGHYDGWIAPPIPQNHLLRCSLRRGPPVA